MNKIKLIDIGAANYQIDKRWIGLPYDLEVFLFEPDTRSLEDLKKLGFTAFSTALSSTPGKRRLNLTRKPQCSSFFKPNLSFLGRFPDVARWEIVGEEDLDVIALDSLGLDVDFIKLDTQGSEEEILIGANETLKGVLGLEIEVAFHEIYHSQPLFGQICSFLHARGFEFFDFITEYRYGRKELDRKGQLAFADALFLRPPETI